MKFHEIFLSTRIKTSPQITQKKQGFCLIRTKYNYPVPGVRSGFGFGFAFAYGFPFPFPFPFAFPVPVRSGPGPNPSSKSGKVKQSQTQTLTTCLADKTNHPVERLSLNRSQCGSCSTKYDTSAGT